MLAVGIALGVLAGYVVAVAIRTHKDLKGARGVVKSLSKKGRADTLYAGLAIITLVVALALYGSGRLD